MRVRLYILDVKLEESGRGLVVKAQVYCRDEYDREIGDKPRWVELLQVIGPDGAVNVEGIKGVLRGVKVGVGGVPGSADAWKLYLQALADDVGSEP